MFSSFWYSVLGWPQLLLIQFAREGFLWCFWVFALSVSCFWPVIQFGEIVSQSFFSLHNTVYLGMGRLVHVSKGVPIYREVSLPSLPLVPLLVGCINTCLFLHCTHSRVLLLSCGLFDWFYIEIPCLKKNESQKKAIYCQKKAFDLKQNMICSSSPGSLCLSQLLGYSVSLVAPSGESLLFFWSFRIPSLLLKKPLCLKKGLRTLNRTICSVGASQCLKDPLGTLTRGKKNVRWESKNRI